MLGKLLGLNPQKSALPKNQIEVVCPVCGAAQREPRLVVTTVCRKCGEHLRIEKRRVIASSQINPVPSAIYPAMGTQSGDRDYPSPSQTQPLAGSELQSAPVADTSSHPTWAEHAVEHNQEYDHQQLPAAKMPSALLPETPLEDDIPPGLGSLVMGVQDQEDTLENQLNPAHHNVDAQQQAQAHIEGELPSENPFVIANPSSEAENNAATTDTDAVSPDLAGEHLESHPATDSDQDIYSSEDGADDESIADESQQASTAAGANPPTRGAFRRFQPIKRAEHNRPEPSTFQKMREQGFRQQHFKEVECFDCHHKFKVGRSARNSQCPACSSTICLEDIDINLTSTTPIRTRGDVYIRKMGNVSTSEIKCRDLNVQGIISANVECTGELTIRTAGTIVGEIHCVRLQVIKGSDIQLINTIYAKEVEIYARVSGNIHCDGPVLIGSGGCVEGDVTARSVNIEPGGHLDGGMNILRPPQKKVAPPEAAQQNLPLDENPEA